MEEEGEGGSGSVSLRVAEIQSIQSQNRHVIVFRSVMPADRRGGERRREDGCNG